MSRRRARTLWYVAGVASAGLMATGCAVGPEFQRPAAPSGDRYDQTGMVLPEAGDGQVRQQLTPGAAPAAHWWQAFDSTALNDTVELALRGSPTLEAAHATLAAANETLAATR
ncbi:MAG: histidine kinase, partial [Nevskiales bacterium]